MYESLRAHLKLYGMQDSDLDRDHMHGRIGFDGQLAYLETYNRLRRMFAGKTVYIRRIFSEGMKVKFLKSLKHEVISKPDILTLIKHPLGALLELVLWLYEFFTGTKVKEMSVMEMCLDNMYNIKSINEFPFDSELEVIQVNERSVLFKDNKGESWTINSAIFACVTQIEVQVNSF